MTGTASSKEDGFSEKSFITLQKGKETVTVFKEYHRRLIKATGGSPSKKTPSKTTTTDPPTKKIKKELPLGEEDEEEAIPFNYVLLDISFKKIPLNKTTYINWIGPLPHPWKFETPSLDICLIVKDPDPKNAKPDRDLDLEETRTFYRDKLEEAGFDEDFLNHRLLILPMRELLTNYMEPEAKGKLVSAYDIFLADKRLMKSKYSGLKTFLGNKFWIKEKKVPNVVDLKKEGGELREEIIRALDQTDLYISGRGQEESVCIGVSSQPDAQLAYNLVHILTQVKETFKNNVQCLKLRMNRASAGSLPFPIFVDMASPNEISEEDIAPRTNPLKGLKAF